MITYYKDYGITASIKDNSNGSAILKVKCGSKTIRNKVYSSRKSAYAAWRRLCD